MLDSRDDDEKAIADGIIDILIAQHPQVQWYDLIYVDWTDDDTPSYFHIPEKPAYAGKHLQKNPVDARTGQAHMNHIHMDWASFQHSADPEDVYDWPPEAMRAGFESAFRASLMALSGSLSQAPPPWLPGWWAVEWRGTTYHYFFDKVGGASYATTPPPKSNVANRIPLTHEDDRGVCTYGPDSVTVRWGRTGSIEVFHRAMVTTRESMTGVWNGKESLSAGKL